MFLRKLLLVLYIFYTDSTLITNFPGMSNFSSNQYHGYLNVTNNHQLHYWFIESQNNPSIDPVILWLSGGPGCSSLFALFTEIGPYLVNSNGDTLTENPYSWNKIANLLFFESPAGVGFSTVSESYPVDDDVACDDHYAAVKEFFNHYPQYRQNDFYAAGESYAGVYIPMLVGDILYYQDVYPINIRGLIIGNGVLDRELRQNTFISYAYYHGFIDESTWERAKTKCCDGDIDECDFSQYTSGFCSYFFEKTHHDARYALLLHRYNMYADCYPFRSRRFRRVALTSLFKDTEPLTCRGNRAVATYLNRPDVRKALSIPPNRPEWKACMNDNFDKLYFKIGLWIFPVSRRFKNATEPKIEKFQYKKLYQTMDKEIKNAVDAGLKVLLHYGDSDMVCNFIHGEKFARSLGYEVSEHKVPFTVNGRHGGFITKYGSNGALEVVIVNGAGHMVPTDRPDVALHILKQFISNPMPVVSGNSLSVQTTTNSDTLPTSESSTLLVPGTSSSSGVIAYARRVVNSTPNFQDPPVSEATSHMNVNLTVTIFLVLFFFVRSSISTIF